MAKRAYRRKSYYRSKGRRRRFRARKSLRAKVASLNRRLAAEVKKNDNAILVPLTAAQGGFEPLTALGLNDFAYLYPVLDASMAQGAQMDDIIGESIKLKYLYIGFHLQQLATGSVPVSLRVMVVQDRNFKQYNNGVPTATEMFTNLFGYSRTSTNQYMRNIDSCLLPYNPLEPGRFRIIRDFRMSTAPGWRSDVYRKTTIVQSRTNSHGKIYFAPVSSGRVGPVSAGVGPNNTVRFYYEVAPNTLPTINLPGIGEIQPTTDSSGKYYQIADSATDEFFKAYPGGVVELTTQSATEGEPANQDISYTTSRNGIYVLILRQNSPTADNQDQVQPAGTLSIQSRFAYYDN